MSRIFTTSLLLATLVGCVSTGDTNVVGAPAGGGSLCARYCSHIKAAGCPVSVSCETECKQEVAAYPTCGGLADTYYGCASVRDVTCDSSGEPNIPTCAGNKKDLDTCRSGGTDSGGD